LEFEKEDIKRKKASDKQARFEKGNAQDDEIREQEEEFEYFDSKMNRLNDKIEYTELWMTDALEDGDEEEIAMVEAELEMLYE